MSQQLNIRGQVSIVSGLATTTFNLTNNLTTTGSNSISNVANIATGSWQVVDQGSNTDFRMGFFANLSTSSTIKLAINSSGTASYAALMQPGDISVLCNSGSAVIYAYASGSQSPALLQYTATEM